MNTLLLCFHEINTVVPLYEFANIMGMLLLNSETSNITRIMVFMTLREPCKNIPCLLGRSDVLFCTMGKYKVCYLHLA